jgi:predicted transcriptional regulator
MPQAIRRFPLNELINPVDLNTLTEIEQSVVKLLQDKPQTAGQIQQAIGRNRAIIQKAIQSLVRKQVIRINPIPLTV